MKQMADFWDCAKCYAHFGKVAKGAVFFLFLGYSYCNGDTLWSVWGNAESWIPGCPTGGSRVEKGERQDSLI